MRHSYRSLLACLLACLFACLSFQDHFPEIVAGPAGIVSAACHDEVDTVVTGEIRLGYQFVSAHQTRLMSHKSHESVERYSCSRVLQVVNHYSTLLPSCVQPSKDPDVVRDITTARTNTSLQAAVKDEWLGCMAMYLNLYLQACSSPVALAFVRRNNGCNSPNSTATLIVRASLP